MQNIQSGYDENYFYNAHCGIIENNFFNSENYVKNPDYLLTIPLKLSITINRCYKTVERIRGSFRAASGKEFSLPVRLQKIQKQVRLLSGLYD